MSKYDKETLEEVKKTGTYRGHELTGRLEVRLAMQDEMALIDLLEDNTKTKSEVVKALIQNKRLYYHLNEKEQNIYYALVDLRLGLKRIKSSLHGLDDKQRLKLFNDDPEYMRSWKSVADQCIEQWGHVIDRLSD